MKIGLWKNTRTLGHVIVVITWNETNYAKGVIQFIENSILKIVSFKNIH